MVISVVVLSVFLPPANKVWGRVMFSHVFVHRGVLPQGGAASGGSANGGGGRTHPHPKTRKADGKHPTGMLSCIY